ncbi:MAG: Omp28-related outer membrane protein [Saprospiraceae bacterium]|nr:Omp28-related outer membrane protein [Saprospiraceae bacterium]
MKKLLPLLALAFLGCEEKEIVIPELSVGKHRVLVEELTGVKCSNCPDGTRLLAQLQETYGKENLIVVSIHEAPDFSVPYTGANANLYDFRTPNGKQMADYVGVFEGAPSAAVDRFSPPNATSLFVLPHTEWPGLITAQFAKDYELGLFVSKTYDEFTRDLDILVNVAPEKTLNGEHRLTVVITQDSIVDTQNDNDNIIKDYVHRHVLRDVITAPAGNVLTESLTAGSVISKSFSLKLPEAWEAKHCSIVAYVHRGGTPDKEVLQATETHVVE